MRVTIENAKNAEVRVTGLVITLLLSPLVGHLICLMLLPYLQPVTSQALKYLDEILSTSV